MIRRNLSSIVYLALLIAAALPYGVFVGSVRMPLWMSLIALAVPAMVIAIVADPVSRAIVHRIEDRAHVRASRPEDADQ